MAILPALFAATLARAGLPTGPAFGAWSFAGKASLAIAAAVALPLLERAGYDPGGANDAQALAALNMAYALLPCALKLPAMLLVARLKDTKIGEADV
jgi:Na+/melibiose symporter-like transporter